MLERAGGPSRFLARRLKEGAGDLSVDTKSSK
jgi:hypothetical protein